MKAIIPAAGIGQRMGLATPKQYLKLAGRTVLEHSVLRLLAAHQIEQVIIALHPADTTFPQLPLASWPQVSVVTGGATRADSVLAALQSPSLADPETLVVVHDAARPGLPRDCLQALLTQATEAPSVGAMLALPAYDTVKQGRAGQVVQTLPRETIWLAQTPQVFQAGSLRLALQAAVGQGKLVTDEAHAMELQGYQPALVMGSRRAMKLTTPEDLPLLEFFLQQELKQEL